MDWFDKTFTLETKPNLILEIIYRNFEVTACIFYLTTWNRSNIKVQANQLWSVSWDMPQLEVLPRVSLKANQFDTSPISRNLGRPLSKIARLDESWNAQYLFWLPNTSQKPILAMKYDYEGMYSNFLRPFRQRLENLRRFLFLFRYSKRTTVFITNICPSL